MSAGVLTIQRWESAVFTVTTTTTYLSGDELSDAQVEQAYQVWLADERLARDEDWAGELWGSLDALLTAAGVTLQGWSIGDYQTDYLRLRHGYGDANDDVLDLAGSRALAWWNNNVLDPLRVPWSGARRRKLAQFGRYYRPGKVPPCPLTGVCYDDTLLDHVWQRLAAGDTIREAVESLAGVAGDMARSEREYLLSSEYFQEYAQLEHDWQVNDDGQIVGMA